MDARRIAIVLLTVAVLALTFARIGCRGANDNETGEEVGSVDGAHQRIVDEVAARAADLLTRYITIDTSNPPGNETAGARFLAEVLAGEGIDSRVLESAPGRGNLYARVAGTGKLRPILLLSHIDVVPARRADWQRDPFAGELSEGKVHGRGALDCKGVGVVELLTLIAASRLPQPLQRDLVLLATADEAAGGKLGAGWFVEHHAALIEDVEYVLNEGGFVHRQDDGRLLYNVNAAEKGPCWFRVVASGPTGHGARPPAETAVTRLVVALERLRRWRRPLEVGPVVARYYAAHAELDPERGAELRDLERALEDRRFRRRFLSDPAAAALVQDTLVPTVLRGSERVNMIPANAFAEVDSRLLPGHDCEEFLDQVRARIGDRHVRVEPAGAAFPASESPLDERLLAAIESVAALEETPAIVLPGLLTGFTDSHWFRQRGIAAFGFAPIDVTREQRDAIHGTDEHVEVRALEDGVRRLFAVVEALSR